MAYLRSLERERSYQPLPLYRDTNSQRSLKLDLNALCIRRPNETFFIQVKNPNLIMWGIEFDDLLIVENHQAPQKNDLIVIEKAGEYKFYQFFNEIEDEKILLALDIREFNLRIQSWQDIPLAGVITNVVHQMRGRQYAA
ncbi:transcriptional regulator [[Actinobacillus] muris]|uniref:Transcriptional regulator n=1 Tax=Muribacter muris TaxID=67855 RepID=A0A0J5P947_9PAST|nr:S24 family peptidase [Muribacter muris]KMK52064.1 transcriptional regulator [[Actinobacillus] muris] [Muribacter muris]